VEAGLFSTGRMMSGSVIWAGPVPHRLS